MNDEILDRLRAVDTGAVSDALDRLGLSGAVLGLPRQSGQQSDCPVVGRAVTVQLGDFTGQGPDRHLCTAAVEASDPDSVIVVANQGRTDAASWGGILSFAAVERGAAAVVIDGATRDLDEVRQLGLRLYARTAVPVSARGRYVEVGWDVPVTVAGIDVMPGDYVVADASGVVVLPAGRALEIVATAEWIMAKERMMITALREGGAITEVMGRDYESATESAVGR